MKNLKKNINNLPSNLLIILGFVDLIRGFMHTVLLKWSAGNIAKMDLTSSSDALFLLGVFGISNILTGLIFLLIGLKAKELSAYVLLFIPIAYLIGIFTLRVGQIPVESAFYGRYFMALYLFLSFTVGLTFLVKNYKKNLGCIL